MPFVSSTKGWNFSAMTVWSYAVTLLGTSTAAAGAAVTGGGGGGGAGGGGPCAGGTTVGDSRSMGTGPDVDVVLLDCSSARSSRREVAASNLTHVPFDHGADWEEVDTHRFITVASEWSPP